MTTTLYADQTDPDMLLAWYANDGTLRNLTGWTLAVELVNPTTRELVATKTTGLSGGNGTGTSNVNIAWTAAELVANIGRWYLRVTATNGAEKAVFTVNTRGDLPALIILAAPAVVP